MNAATNRELIITEKLQTILIAAVYVNQKPENLAILQHLLTSVNFLVNAHSPSYISDFIKPRASNYQNTKLLSVPRIKKKSAG